MISRYKDHYEPISKMEFHKDFERCLNKTAKVEGLQMVFLSLNLHVGMKVWRLHFGVFLKIWRVECFFITDTKDAKTH